jgi:hypothetical protein
MPRIAHERCPVGDAPRTWSAARVPATAANGKINVPVPFFSDALLETARANYCFAAETPMKAFGGDRAIKDIQVGDLVLAAAEHNPHQPAEWKRVEEKFVTRARLCHLLVNGQLIRTTGEHPFFAWNKWQWVGAKDLQPGDLLRTHDDRLVAVDSVIDSGEEEEVYNLRVADYHTYFVGCEEWGWSAWAHNVCRISRAELAEAGRPEIRERGETIPGRRSGSPGNFDHQILVAEAKAYALDMAGPGETVHTSQRIRGHDSRRMPDVQIRDAEGNTRYIIEVEREPDSLRNLLREAEYDLLGIPHETWPM